MNGVLGSLKNMLKRWRINFRKKKKQDEVKIYNRKITKYPKLTSFIYSTIAIIYCPFGYMFARSNKQVRNEQPKLYKKTEKINIKLDEMIVKKENNVKTIEKDIFEVKKQIEIPMSKESKNYFNSKLKEIEIKIQFIKNPDKISNIEAEVIKESLEKSSVKHKNVNKKLLQSLPISLILVKQKKEDKFNFIKQANKELKNINEQIKNIENKISNVNQYNHFYDLENELKYLRKKIEALKEKYEEIKDYLNLEVDYDKYKLCKSPKKIDETLEAKITEPIEIRNIYVDGKGVGDLEESIFYDREQLSLNGVVVANVVAKKNNTGQYDIKVDLESKGFTYNGGEKDGIINKTEQLREEGINSATEAVRKLLNRNKRTPSTIKYEVREALRKKFIQIIGREPVIFVCLYMDHVYIEKQERF